MKPIIALWTMTLISFLAIWSAIEQWKTAKSKKDKETLSSYLIGACFVTILTILAWVL